VGLGNPSPTRNTDTNFIRYKGRAVRDMICNLVEEGECLVASLINHVRFISPIQVLGRFYFQFRIYIILVEVSVF
jgi:hypothetical protein